MWDCKIGLPHWFTKSMYFFMITKVKTKILMNLIKKETKNLIILNIQ